MMTTENPLKGVSTAAGPSVHSTEEEVSGVSSLSNRRFRALYLYFCLQESRALGHNASVRMISVPLTGRIYP